MSNTGSELMTIAPGGDVAGGVERTPQSDLAYTARLFDTMCDMNAPAEDRLRAEINIFGPQPEDSPVQVALSLVEESVRETLGDERIAAREKWEERARRLHIPKPLVDKYADDAKYQELSDAIYQQEIIQRKGPDDELVKCMKSVWHSYVRPKIDYAKLLSEEQG